MGSANSRASRLNTTYRTLCDRSRRALGLKRADAPLRNHLFTYSSENRSVEPSNNLLVYKIDNSGDSKKKHQHHKLFVWFRFGNFFLGQDWLLDSYFYLFFCQTVHPVSVSLMCVDQKVYKPPATKILLAIFLFNADWMQ